MAFAGECQARAFIQSVEGLFRKAYPRASWVPCRTRRPVRDSDHCPWVHWIDSLFGSAQPISVSLSEVLWLTSITVQPSMDGQKSRDIVQGFAP